MSGEDFDFDMCLANVRAHENVESSLLCVYELLRITGTHMAMKAFTDRDIELANYTPGIAYVMMHVIDICARLELSPFEEGNEKMIENLRSLIET